MTRLILFLLIAYTAVADTWLADGRTLGAAASVDDVEEITFANGVRLSATSNGVSVLVGTNSYSLLKDGDVAVPDVPVFDDFSIVDQPTGTKGVAARYDLNDSLFAWHISQIEGGAYGMVDSWFWSPNSLTGIADNQGSFFVPDTGFRNFEGGPSYALSLDGSADHAISANPHGVTGGEYSLQAWVYRIKADGIGETILKFGYWPNYCESAALTTWQDYWILDGGGCAVNSTPGFFTNEWVHLVATASNGAGTVYFNGVEIASGSFAPSIAVTNIQIGMRPENNYPSPFGGLLDECVIWNRCISSNEVAALYNNGDGYYLTSGEPMGADAVAIYHFDLPLDPNYASIRDSSTALNDCFIYGGPTLADGKVQAPQVVAGTTNISEAIPVEFVPATVRGIVMTKSDSPLTTNDLALAVSRDGGSTWSGVPLAGSTYPTTESTYQLFTGLIAVTNQPSGTQIVFRVTQADTAAQFMCGMGGSWR